MRLQLRRQIVLEGAGPVLGERCRYAPMVVIYLCKRAPNEAGSGGASDPRASFYALSRPVPHRVIGVACRFSVPGRLCYGLASRCATSRATALHRSGAPASIQFAIAIRRGLAA